jgi:hypothetical protein
LLKQKDDDNNTQGQLPHPALYGAGCWRMALKLLADAAAAKRAIKPMFGDG